MKLEFPLQRVRYGQIAGAALALSGLIMLSQGDVMRVAQASLTSIEAYTPRLQFPPRTNRLPFSHRDVVSYFADALGFSPKQVGNITVFSNPANENELLGFEVLVTQNEADLFVSVSGQGDYAMTIAREFFEAPFFSRGETLGLYAALNRGRDGQTLRYPRFTAHVEVVQHREDFHVTLQFSPHTL
jgi:hypothetical protein